MRARLGVYVDTVYRTAEPATPGEVFTNAEAYPFLRFVSEVGGHFDALLLFGRCDPARGGTDHPLPRPARVVPLPYYDGLARGGQVLRALPGTVRGMWRGLDDVDVVWVFGPHPLGVVLIGLAVLRRRPVVLGVRQDTMRYFRSRLPGRRAAPVLAPLWAVDRLYRLLARRLPTIVAGEFLAQRYAGPAVVPLRVSLVRAADVVRKPAERDWSGTVELLSVGRIEPEKSPLVLVEALAELERRRPGRYRLMWVGEGRLAGSVRTELARRGLSQRVDLRGFVPFGPELLGLYRGAHMFVHTAVTEAFGQVLVEAMASGTPIVATAVGGVTAALDGGGAGVLVAPRDPAALADGIERMTDDAALRGRVVLRGLELARRHSLEAESERAARVLSLTRPR